MSHFCVNSCVHRLIDNKLNFEQFVMTCARGFGLLIHMRDSSLDAVIPDVIEPDSYHREELARCEEALTKLSSTPDSQLAIQIVAQRKATNAEIEKSNAEIRVEFGILKSMRAELDRWNPPTELQEMKDSIVKWVEEPLSEKRELEELDESPIDVGHERAEHVKHILISIEYHRKHWEDNQRLATERNDLLQKLRESLKAVTEQAGRY